MQCLPNTQCLPAHAQHTPHTHRRRDGVASTRKHQRLAPASDRPLDGSTSKRRLQDVAASPNIVALHPRRHSAAGWGTHTRRMAQRLIVGHVGVGIHSAQRSFRLRTLAGPGLRIVYPREHATACAAAASGSDRSATRDGGNNAAAIRMPIDRARQNNTTQ